MEFDYIFAMNVNILYSSQDEQRSIFSTLLKAHFVPPAIIARAPEGTEEVLSSKVILQIEREGVMKKLIESLVAVTVEVQENLRSMFLPTPSRSHYIFTLNNLGIIFK